MRSFTRTLGATVASGGSSVLGVSGVAALIVAWWLVSRKMDPVVLPSPRGVVNAIRSDFLTIPGAAALNLERDGVLSNLAYTLTTVCLGVGVGSCIGVAFGVVLARVRLMRDLFEPPLVVLGTMPLLIVQPFLLIWFGTARIAQAGLVIAYSAIVVLLATQQATYNIAGRFESYAASLGANRVQRMRSVILPAVIPEVLGAVRVAFGAAWGLAVIAELLGAPAGIGRVIQLYTVTTSTAHIMGVLICVGVLAVAIDGLLMIVGRWMIRWQE